MATSFAQAGASHIAIGARSSLDSLKEDLLAAAAKANRPAPKVLCVKLDITSQQSTEEAAKLVEQGFGKLDILINNAGVIGKMKLVADSDPDAWWQTWNVNIRGPYLMTRAFLPLMLKGGDKTIISTSSVGAHLTSPSLSDYQPSKLAVLRFMQFVSEEYKDKGVLAFSIHPGNIPTDMIGGPAGVPEHLKPSECSRAEVGVALLTNLLVFVETAELSADTIVYLVREKRPWLAGRYINCTWDMPELMAQEEEIVKGDKLKVRLVI
jgi:NAD(P)-dependent dehydrogenase (short-subunit alcohol dehydrogenase family)